MTRLARFVVALVLVVVVSVAVAAVFAPDDSEHPPHAQHRERGAAAGLRGRGDAEGTQEAAGSQLGGIGVAVNAVREWVGVLEANRQAELEWAERAREDALIAEWWPQAVCETGGNWQMQGPRYSGGLGFLNESWLAYGGGEFAPNAGLATPLEQVTVAERIQSGPSASPGRCVGW